MENTNNKTRIVNRVRKGSCDIYDREKRRTLPEINKIEVPNSVARGSSRMGKLIWWAVKVNKFHSRRIRPCLEIRKLVRINMGNESVRRRRGQSEGMENIA